MADTGQLIVAIIGGIAVVATLMRLLSARQAAIAPLDGFETGGYGQPDCDPPVPRRRAFGPGTIVGFGFIAVVCWFWFRYGSIDEAVWKTLQPLVGDEGTGTRLDLRPDQDVCEVNGIRWFRVLGTTTTGIGYRGWVSEFGLLERPPDPVAATDVAALLGLPSMRERLEAAKQLREIGEELRRQRQRK